MKKTFNNCSFTELWVSPANWKTTTSKASLSKNWYIQCYFFDPRFKEKYPDGKPYRKKLNKFKTLEERKAAAEFFLEEIPKLFSEKGFNPITKKYMIDLQDENHNENDVTPGTKFLQALDFAKGKMKIADTTSSDLRGVIKFVKQSAKQLNFDKLNISDVKRKHIKLIIDNLEHTEGIFSGHKYNKYRTYLQMLFSELLEYEAVDSNIIKDMKKRVQTKNIREVLTAKERLKIKEHLSDKYPSFWNFTEIFFHSGGRETELLRLQIKDVDLEKQVYRTLIVKGNKSEWKERVIKHIALPLWRKTIFGARPDDYVFSTGLVPGPKMIRREQIGRRWKSHVKDKLGIKADFYALKHLNLDETTEQLSLKDAALMAGHSNTKMVEQVYAVGENARAIERLKQINNKFA